MHSAKLQTVKFQNNISLLLDFPQIKIGTNAQSEYERGLKQASEAVRRPFLMQLNQQAKSTNSEKWL